MITQCSSRAASRGRETPEGGTLGAGLAAFGEATGLRVTGGRLGGRRIRVPAAGGVRPTADRVREALFARLPDLEGAHVLDLYAGSGALGIEALSRGAVSAVFIERAAPVLAVLRANLQSLDLGGATEVVRGDVAAGVRRLAHAGRRFDLVLLDPPYRDPLEAPRALRALSTSGILAAGALVVVETSRRPALPPIDGLEPLDERRYGDTVIHRLTARPPAAGGAGEA